MAGGAWPFRCDAAACWRGGGDGERGGGGASSGGAAEPATGDAEVEVVPTFGVKMWWESEARADGAGVRASAPARPGEARVRVLLFASARELAGVGEYEAVLPAGSRASALRALLKARFVLLGVAADEAPLAVNQAYIGPSADPVLADGDEVALIPPISGG
jgi:molybdopterin converting factor small subunit